MEKNDRKVDSKWRKKGKRKRVVGAVWEISSRS
jgi:hypothetical protein